MCLLLAGGGCDRQNEIDAQIKGAAHLLRVISHHFLLSPFRFISLDLLREGSQDLGSLLTGAGMDLLWVLPWAFKHTGVSQLWFLCQTSPCIKRLLGARHLPGLLGTLSEDHLFWLRRAAVSAKGLRSHLRPVYAPLVFMFLETLSYTLLSEFLTYLFCGLWSVGT